MMRGSARGVAGAAIRLCRSATLPRSQAFCAAAQAEPALSKNDILGFRSRSALVEASSLVAGLQQDLAMNTNAASALSLPELCRTCRVLAAAGYRVEDRLLTLGIGNIQSLADSSKGTLTKEGAAAGADLILAACESGRPSADLLALFDTLVGNLSSLDGASAASMVLVAAVLGRADEELLDSLLTVCSANEMDLAMSDLGDIKLALGLLNPSITENLSARSASFLRVLVADAVLDDQRAIQDPEVSVDLLTRFEAEIATTLQACEVLHDHGAIVQGIGFPMVSYTRKSLFVAEDRAAGAVYVNAPGERTELQRWKYRVAASHGWTVVPVAATQWQKLMDESGRTSFLGKLIRSPPEHESL